MVDLQKFWKNKNVLVTGAGGFIGKNLANFLHSLGANVVGLSSRKDGCNFFVKDVDIRDYYELRNVISSFEIEYIFHLAAVAIVRISAKDPLSTYEINVLGTVALLEAARNVGKVKSIVVASSDKAYGDHDMLPYLETFELVPKNTYDTSKACADMIARSYAKNYSMPVCVTRCSNVFGPGDENFSRIVPNTIRRLVNDEKPQLYSDVENMEREFIFIDDVSKAYALLGAVDPGLVSGEAYNIGGTGPMRVIDVVKIISGLMQKNIDCEILLRDESFKEIQKQHIDSTKLQKVTGWVPPTAESFSQSMQETINWYVEKFQEK